MSYIGTHPVQTDRTTSGTFQVNELIERQKRGMHPNSSWDLVGYVNTRDGDSNIADAYDFALPDYDVFYLDIAESSFQTGTSQSSAEPRIQFSEDNGTTFLSANYPSQRSYGDSTSTTINNSGFATTDGIRLTTNTYHITVPTFGAYAYIFNAKTNGKRTTIVGKAHFKNTSATANWGEFFGNNTSTNVTTDIRFYTSDIGQANAQIVLVASLWGCKNYGK